MPALWITHFSPQNWMWNGGRGLQAAGDGAWWKLREAAMLAVGAVAEPLLEAPGASDRDFDLASFLNTCLTEDLSASTPPYLLARALWVASR